MIEWGNVAASMFQVPSVCKSSCLNHLFRLSDVNSVWLKEDDSSVQKCSNQNNTTFIELPHVKQLWEIHITKHFLQRENICCVLRSECVYEEREQKSNQQQEMTLSQDYWVEVDRSGFQTKDFKHQFCFTQWYPAFPRMPWDSWDLEGGLVVFSWLEKCKSRAETVQYWRVSWFLFPPQETFPASICRNTNAVS